MDDSIWRDVGAGLTFDKCFICNSMLVLAVGWMIEANPQILRLRNGVNTGAGADVVAIFQILPKDDGCDIDPSNTYAKNKAKCKVSEAYLFAPQKTIRIVLGVVGMTPLLKLLMITLRPSWSRAHHSGGKLLPENKFLSLRDPGILSQLDSTLESRRELLCDPLSIFDEDNQMTENLELIKKISKYKFGHSRNFSKS